MKQPVSEKPLSHGPLRVWLLLVFLTAIAVYALTIGHGFTFDDGIVIERNLDIRSLSNLPQVFTHSEWEGGGLENHLYRPLTSFTYALNYAVSGLSPWSYHLLNVLLHGVVSVLLVFIGLRWRLPVAAAGVGALLFAVHPIHVEAVANVIGRKELLVTLFLVLMALGHGRAMARGGTAMLWPVLAYAAAMLSKEAGVVGIALVALHDVLLPGERPKRKAARRRALVLYTIYAVLLALYLLVRRAVAGTLPADQIPFIDNPLAQESLLVRFMTAIAVLGKGLGLQILPLGQSADYSYNAIPVVRSPADLRFLAAAAAIGLWAWLGFRLRRTTPAVLIGAGWYLLAILPASNLLFSAGTIFGERLLYMPSVGFALVAGWLLFERIGGRSRAAYLAVSCSLAAVLTFAAVNYAAVWRDNGLLFQKAAASVPNAARVHHKLGEQYVAERRYADAERALRRSLDIYSDGQHSYGLLGDVFVATGRPEEARRMYRSALEADPGNGNALYGLGRIEREEGNLGLAERFWLQALESNPRQSGALSDLGTLAYSRGDVERAREYWERAVLYEPLLASAWYNLGLLYRESGDAAQAESAFRQFLSTAGPEYQEAIRYVEELLGGPR